MWHKNIIHPKKYFAKKIKVCYNGIEPERLGSGLSQAFLFRCEGIVKKDIAMFLHRYIPDLSYCYGWGAVGVYIKATESLNK